MPGPLAPGISPRTKGVSKARAAATASSFVLRAQAAATASARRYATWKRRWVLYTPCAAPYEARVRHTWLWIVAPLPQRSRRRVCRAQRKVARNAERRS